MGLDGRVAVATGAGSGIGDAVARRLAADGAQVLVADLDLSSADQVAADICASGAAAVACQVDVTVDKSVRDMVAAALDAFSGVDVLVNNAGLTGPAANVVDLDESDWDKVWAVNVKGGCGHQPREVSGAGPRTSGHTGQLRVSRPDADAGCPGGGAGRRGSCSAVRRHPARRATGAPGGDSRSLLVPRLGRGELRRALLTRHVDVATMDVAADHNQAHLVLTEDELARVSAVSDDVSDAALLYRVVRANVGGFLNVLEAAGVFGLGRIVWARSKNVRGVDATLRAVSAAVLDQSTDR